MTPMSQADEVARLRNVERLMAYLWNAELPITAAMRAQKAIGDTMTVRDVFNHGNPDDPLVTDVDLVLAPSALADLRDDASARDDTHGGAS